MTEEIIIFEQDGNIVGITKEGKYFESYKTTENVAILRGAGLYIKRLEQENKELSKLIRGTKDYAEVCSVCKDEVTIYPNISGRTDYTQNEVECRTLAQIITQKNNMEQENKDLKKQVESQKGLITEGGKQQYEMTMAYDKCKSALEEIKNIILTYESKEWNCFNDMDAKLEQISKVINEVLK